MRISWAPSTRIRINLKTEIFFFVLAFSSLVDAFSGQKNGPQRGDFLQRWLPVFVWTEESAMMSYVIKLYFHRFSVLWAGEIKT